VAGPDIFISYSREERPAARHFAESFTREGFTVWWDAVLRSGQTFDEVIERELRAAKAVVVLWSPRSVASRWVRAEATLADRGNKLVPVIIEPCNLPIIFELTHAADLSDWAGETDDARWQALVSDLKRMVSNGEEESIEALPEPAPKPKSIAVPKTPAPDVAPPAEHPAGNDATPVERVLPDLNQPTDEEVELTQFFKRSDAYRMQEGDRFHCLHLVNGDQSEQRYVVSPAGLTIGRSAPADIIVPGSAVSRAHCTVELAGEKLRVTDLNSTNGTFIDDIRVNRSAMLEVGSTLRVGNATFEHEVGERAGTAYYAELARVELDVPRESRLAKS
jgi:hypothetical protein